MKYNNKARLVAQAAVKWNVAKLARQIKVSRVHMSQFINGHVNLSEGKAKELWECLKS